MVENYRFENPTSIWRPRWNFAEIFGISKQESLGYRMALIALS